MVRLSLDPTKFDEGQKRLYDALRRMEGEAKRGGDRVTKEVTVSTVGFFRAIEHPFASLRQRFEQMATYTEPTHRALKDLGERGRRTGEDVASGALAGARGLRALGAVSVAIGTAGLTAFAAYEALSKAMSVTSGVAQRLFQTGIGAQSAGIDITSFGAEAQALHNIPGTNIPVEQTQATLVQWKTWQDLARTAAGTAAGGQAIQAMQNMQVGLNSIAASMHIPGLGGIDVRRGDVWQNMMQIAKALAAIPNDQFNPTAIAGALEGTMTPVQVSGLRRVGQMPQAELDRQLDIERQRAARPDQQKQAEDFIAAENRLSTSMDAFVRAFTTGPLGDALRRALDWATEGISASPIPEHGVTSLDPKQYYRPGLFFGQPGDPTTRDPRGVIPLIRAAAEKWGTVDPDTAVRVFMQEGIGVYAGDYEGGKPTSFGAPQLHAGGRVRGLGDVYKELTGHDPADMSNEPEMIDFSIRNLPITGWGPYHGAKRAGVSEWQGINRGTTPSKDPDQPTATMMNQSGQKVIRDKMGNWVVAPGQGIEDHQHGGFISFDQISRLHAGEVVWSAAQTGEMARALQRDRAGGGVGVSSIHRIVNVDRIVVNAPVREARAIGDAVAERIRRVSLATSSNTGLE